MNLGAAHSVQGGLADCVLHVQQALAMCEGLVAAGRTQPRIDMARTQMNLGSALLTNGRSDDAVQRLRSAWAGHKTLLRQPGPLRGSTRPRSSCAMTAMNLGLALNKAGDPVAAERHIAHALRQNAALTDAQPRLQDDVARIRVNHCLRALWRPWWCCARCWRSCAASRKTCWPMAPPSPARAAPAPRRWVGARRQRHRPVRRVRPCRSHRRPRNRLQPRPHTRRPNKPCAGATCTSAAARCADRWWPMACCWRCCGWTVPASAPPWRRRQRCCCWPGWLTGGCW